MTIDLYGIIVYLPAIFIGITKTRKAAVGKWAYIYLDQYVILPSRHEVRIKPMRIINQVKLQIQMRDCVLYGRK